MLPLLEFPLLYSNERVCVCACFCLSGAVLNFTMQAAAARKSHLFAARFLLFNFKKVVFSSSSSSRQLSVSKGHHRRKYASQLHCHRFCLFAYNILKGSTVVIIFACGKRGRKAFLRPCSTTNMKEEESCC